MYLKKKVHINGSPLRNLKNLGFGENKIQIKENI
jgi:hypothetical protein